MSKKLSRELVVGAVVRNKRLVEAKRWLNGYRDVNPKGVVLDIREAPTEHPTWGRSYRVVRLERSRHEPGVHYVASHWDSEQDLEVLGRVKRLPRCDESPWSRLSTVSKLSLAPGNRVRIAGTKCCGTVVSVGRHTIHTASGHRAVVLFDNGVEEEFFHGLAADGRRIVRGGCGPDLIDPLTTDSYQLIGTSERGAQERQRARELHREIHQEPRARRLRYMSDPHGRCENASYCVEHEAIPAVPPCEYGARR